MDLPKKNDCFVCSECGMEIRVLKDCKCDDDECPCFKCCGLEMGKKTK